MFCSHCGCEQRDKAKFCSQCGHALPPAGGMAAKGKKSAAIPILSCVTLLLAICLLLQNFGVVGLVASGNMDLPAGDQPSRLEGPGYASPEDAVQAYIAALQTGDVSAAVATFAIESYIDAVDVAAGLTYMGTWLPGANFNGNFYAVTGGDYERQLLIGGRQAAIMRNLYLQLLTYSDCMNDGRNVILDDEASVAAFLNRNGDGRFEQALAGMEFVAFVDPAALYPYYAEESAVQNRQRVMNEWGLNAYQDMAAQVKLGGEDWLLLLSCGKYGDRWYNLSQIGQLATYLGLSTYVGGLAPYGDIVD